MNSVYQKKYQNFGVLGSYNSAPKQESVIGRHCRAFCSDDGFDLGCYGCGYKNIYYALFTNDKLLFVSHKSGGDAWHCTYSMCDGRDVLAYCSIP